MTGIEETVIYVRMPNRRARCDEGDERGQAVARGRRGSRYAVRDAKTTVELR